MREATLIAFGHATGISREKLIEGEKPDRLYLEHDIVSSQVALITEETVTNLLDSFGEAIHIEIGIPDFPADIIIDSSVPVTETAEQITKIMNARGSENLQLTIALDKGKLVEQMEVFSQSTKTVLFFLFEDNLVRYLSINDTITLCQLLFSQPTIPTIIILAERNEKIDGIFFHVISENRTPEIDSLASPSKSEIQATKTLARLAQTAIRWIGFQFPTATPLQFQLDKEAFASTGLNISRVVYRHFVTLFIMHTANIILLSDNRFEATYVTASGDQITRFSVTGEPDYEPSTYEQMLAILEWLSGQSNGEKLRYLQTVIAKDFPEEIVLSDFIAHVERIFRDAKLYFSVSIDDKVTKNFDSIQAISRFVAQTNSEIGVAVDNLTKGLNDAFIAAIGVVVGGLITALTGGKTTSAVFSILMISYVIYIVLFQVAFRMKIIWNSYTILSDSASNQLEEYSVKLGVEKRDQLTASLQRRRQQFCNSYRTTRFAFVVMAILFGLLAVAGPSLFLGNATSQQATATLTVTATLSPNSTFTTNPSFALTPSAASSSNP